VEAIMKQLTANFLGDIINYSVYAAIVALLLLSFAKCVLPVWRTRALLRRAIRNIKQGEKSKRSWQEDDFLGKGALYPHWSEYLDNLFFADGEYHNASNVEDYINEETVISQPGRSALASAAPGLMVSLGFLGTLLGITQGLAGFSMENSEAVMEMMTKATPSAGASLIDSLLRLAMAVVGVGFSLFVMNSVRRSQPALGNLLDGFGMFPRVLFLIILQIVLIFLWSLLLVIPGIIAAYRYSFAVYVMIDHPEMSAMDCLRESKRLTTGYKRQLFLLDLSFILWFLLTMIPVVGYIAQVYVTPYMESARVLYYEQIRALQSGKPANET